MAYTKEQRIINNLSGNTKKQRNEKKDINLTGSFDIPNKSGDHMRSYKRDTPTKNIDLVNKKYVDDDFLMLDGSNQIDNTSTDTAYPPLVLFNTDETPPTASNFPKGTIYIQYEA